MYIYIHASFLAFSLINFSCFYRWLFRALSSKGSVLGKLVSSTSDKKNDPLLGSNSALRYRIAYIDENFQAAITFNNLARIL